MNRIYLRQALEVTAMLAVVVIAAVTGWGCICKSSDYNSSGQLASRDRQAGDGRLDHWSDLIGEQVSVSAKDMRYLQEFLGSGEVGVGVLVPTAPGASQPGDVFGYPNVYVSFETDDYHQFTVPMTTSQSLADTLEQASPAPQGTHWQALVPSSFDWLSQVPTQTGVFTNVYTSLYYGLDFHGTDLCNHCQVSMTGCSTRSFNPVELAVLRRLAPDGALAGPEIRAGEFTCTPLVNTTLVVHGFGGETLPGPLVLGVGIYGLSPYTATSASSLSLPIDVSHTSEVTMSVDLAPIRSAQGWNYTWTLPDGTPVTRVDVAPMADYPLDLNLRVHTDNLPQCARLLDTVTMTATAVLTPSLTGSASTSIQLLPDPAHCATADVGIYQVTSSRAISAGLPLTLTWTITNFETSQVTAAVSGTLSPLAAVGSVELAPGCSRSGGLVTCQVDLPASGQVQVVSVVHSANTFNGLLEAAVQAEPVGAGDPRFYDNSAGPASITISGGTPLRSLFLPYIKRE